jgi:hypothetical protein
MRRRATLLFVALCASAASAQTPPLELKGIQIGEPLSKVKDVFPGASCGETYCWVRTESEISKRCALTDTKCRSDASKDLMFGPVYAREYWFYPRDGNIGRIKAIFGAPQTAKLILALQEKYGPPTSDAVETVTNRMGAKFDNRIVNWTRTDGTINVTQRGYDVEFGTAVIEAAGYSQAESAKEAKEIKDSAKRL